MTVILLIVIYCAFIGLGLPDSLLGSAWPALRLAVNADVDKAGLILMIISLGTILSSLFASRIIAAAGTKAVTFVSIMLTAAAIFGFSFGISVPWLCLMAIPLGIGAGCVDCALNNFVALHFKAKHLSWLHCFWGIGATLGPVLLSRLMANGGGWSGGYRLIALLQAIIAALVLLSFPIWRQFPEAEKSAEKTAHVSNLAALRLPYVKFSVAAFFFYSGAEVSTGLWISSYLVSVFNMASETAAACAAVYYAGITVGRLISGFLSIRLSSPVIIRLGGGISVLGIIFMLFGFSPVLSVVAVGLIGLGFAPIYPCMLQQTPARFGAENSQAVMGLQLAAGYLGGLLVSPFTGFVAGKLGLFVLPIILMLSVLIFFIFTELINAYLKRRKKAENKK